MAEDYNSDDYRTLAKQLFGKASAIYEQLQSEPKNNDASEIKVPSVLVHSPANEISSPAAANPQSIELTQQRQLKTAAELAEMIERALSRHPDCPKAGFQVTIYGWPHWRAMLTIAPAAGAVRNPNEWRDLTSELAERLRKRYGLACE